MLAGFIGFRRDGTRRDGRASPSRRTGTCPPDRTRPRLRGASRPAPRPRAPPLPPAGSTGENKSGLLIYCSGGRPEEGQCERKSKPVFFPETAVLPGIPPSHPGDNPPPAKDEQKPRCPRPRRSSGPSNRPREAAEQGPAIDGGEGQPLPWGRTWDRASERRVYPAIALNPDLNHSIRNQNSLKRESAGVLFTRSAPSTRTVQQRAAEPPRRQQRPRSGLSAALRAPVSNNPGLLRGSDQPFVRNPAYRTWDSGFQNNQAHGCQHKYQELLKKKKNDTRGTGASPSTRDTLSAESPGDDGFILPCLSDPSLAGNPRTMAEPAGWRRRAQRRVPARP